MSVPSGLVGSGSSPAARRGVVLVVVVLAGLELLPDDEADDPDDEHAPSATPALATPAPIRKLRRERGTPEHRALSQSMLGPRLASLDSEIVLLLQRAHGEEAPDGR